MSIGSPLASVYRALLRKARELQQAGTALHFQTPFNDASWGSYRFSGPVFDHSPIPQQVLPFLAQPPRAPQLTGSELASYVRKCFNDSSMTAPEGDPLVQAFASLRALSDQLYLMRCSSKAESDGIVVQANAYFDQMARDPRDEDLKYQFTYRVRITNNRDRSVQVLGREWEFLSESGKVEQEVHLSPTNAVVGQQPVLPSGASFEYYSGAFLSTPTGVAKGRLLVFIPGNPDTQILAQIAPFKLRIPSQTGAQL